ncbi:MAG: bifunctional UDP-N-acetylglucosamine diphosphorylase/glucosamine-1-phosphate N-acetyltransferase GlmU, partial [Deltaproteobacteria bacterium]|nr:bifunctional UDP-N-acetylglucosamine diphosphorylase/glucosamine-1-phosphate N-acetyltransferase GlmU [Deltaproteobacteria bacterium]
MAAIILAAGKGTRMKSPSGKSKVLFEVAGKPMLQYPLEVAQQLGCNLTVIVVGHSAEAIEQRFGSWKKVEFALQKQQLGSAHAVLAAQKALKGFKGDVVILSGDVPRVKLQTVQSLLKKHRQEKNALTLATFIAENPTGYGRVLCQDSHLVEQIIEEGDLSEDQKEIQEVNAGLYVASAPLLFEALLKIKKNPKKQEFYFTDLPAVLRKMKKRVGKMRLIDSSELQGVNTRAELAQVEAHLQNELRHFWMLEGVSMKDPARVYLESCVKLSSDVEIGLDVSLHGNSQIGVGCQLGQGVILKNVILKEGVKIHPYSHLENCVVESEAVVGPFARIRPDSKVERKAHVGNFVELKKTVLGEGSKANHLSYLGDALIG